MSTGKDVDYLKNKINIVLESFLSRQRTESLIHRLLTFKTPCGQRFVFTGHVKTDDPHGQVWNCFFDSSLHQIHLSSVILCVVTFNEPKRPNFLEYGIGNFDERLLF